jgi:hypothetical protein
MKIQVTLVRNSSILYPHTDKDFDHLSKLGTPIRKIDDAYLPVLREFASGIKFHIVSLTDLEATMLSKFKNLWPHEVELTSKNITLMLPRSTPEPLIEKAVNALKKWYREHFIILEQVTKRSGKTIKIVLVKKVVV